MVVTVPFDCQDRCWEAGTPLWAGNVGKTENLGRLLTASSLIKLKIILLDYFYLLPFWLHKLLFFNDSISSNKKSFSSLTTVISDIEFND